MKNIKLFVTFVASLFFLFSCEKEKVETCGFDTIRLTESFLTEYAKGDGVDNYMIALASGSTVFDPTNQQWHTENDGWVMLISLFAEPVANLGAPEIPEGKYTLGSAPGAGVWSSEEDVNQLYYTGKDGVSTLVPVSGELTFAKTADGYIMTGKFLAADQKEYCVTYTGTLKFQPQGETSVIDQPVNTKFIGGQAIYKGPDPSFGDLGWVQLELYDAEPDPEMGTILGNFLKIKMFIPIQTEKFTSMPSGTWKLNASADENTAEPGYDSGEDLPTGSYVVQTSSDGSTMKLGMLNQGTITVTEDQHVVIDAYTTEGISVKGNLNKPLEILDLGGGEVDDSQYSTLTTDKVIDLSGAETAYFLDYEDYYENGTRNVVLQILDSQSMTGMFLDLALSKADNRYDPLPNCTCTLDPGDNRAFTSAGGSIWQSNAVGTWGFLKLQTNGETIMPDFSEAGNAAGGSLTITRNGDEYTITVNFIDDAETPHRITGTWTGTLTPYSYTASVSGLLEQSMKPVK